MVWLWIMSGCGLESCGEPAPCQPRGVPTTLETIRPSNVEDLQSVGTLCPVRAPPGSVGGVTVISFLADSKQVVAGGQLGGLQLWDVSDGSHRTMSVDPEITALATLPERGSIVLGLIEGSMVVLDRDGSVLWEAVGASGHEGAVQGIAVLEDASEMISVSRDGEVRRWSLADPSPLVTRELRHELGGAARAGQDLILCGASFPPTALDWDTLTTVNSWPLEDADCGAVAIQPDTMGVAVSTDRVSLWDGQLEVRIDRPIRGTVRDIAFDPRGDLLAVGTLGGQLLVYEVDSRQLFVEHADLGRVHSLAFSTDGTLIATGGDDGTVRLWGVPADR